MELKEVQVSKTIWIRNDGYIKCTAKNAVYKGYWRESKYKDYVMLDKNTRVRVSRLIAYYFIPKTEEDIRLGRDVIDHITHTPDGMNINDVRNLRWCTKHENDTFPEAHEHKCKAQRGNKKHTDESRKKIGESTKKRWEEKRNASR